MNNKPLFRGLTLGLVLGLGLGGCASTPEPGTAPDARALPDTLLPEIDAALAEAEASRPAPAVETDVERALVPRLQLDLPERTAVDTEPRFDIKVNRARARDFYQGQSRPRPRFLHGAGGGHPLQHGGGSQGQGSHHPGHEERPWT